MTLDDMLKDARHLAHSAFATAEGEAMALVKDLREAQSKIDADAYDYGDKQKGQAADVIEALLAFVRTEVNRL